MEVLLDSKLLVVYFPIPSDCRTQLANRLVEVEMYNVMDKVDRTSAEAKLDNFLDASMQVSTVIELQASLDSPGLLNRLIRFLVRNELSWMFVVGGLTAYFNVVLMRYGAIGFGMNSDGYTTLEEYRVYNVSSHQNETFYAHTEGLQYLPRHIYNQVQYVAPAHAFFSLLLFLSYLLGTSVVGVYKGFNWKRCVANGTVSLPLSEPLSHLYFLCDRYVPNAIWTAVFLFLDFKIVYYIAFFFASLLGWNYSVSFYCFHILELVVRIKLMSYILNSVLRNWDQLLITVLLAGIIIWLYVVAGIYFFGFESYNFGESVPGPRSLWGAFAEALDFGLRSAPA